MDEVMYYFAYGSNMNCQIMWKWGINFLSRKRGQLYGYVLVFNKIADENQGEGKANIVPAQDGAIEGVLYEINYSEMSKLDNKEGVRGGHYTKEKVSVLLPEDGKEVIATTYIANRAKTSSGLKPRRDYLCQLLAAVDVLPDYYLDRVRTTKTLD